MNLKTIKFLDIFIIFILMSIFHFAYQIFQNTLFSIFFPVNESIFEHLKLIFNTYIIFSIIDYFLLKKFHLDNNNFITNTFVSASSCIIIFLTIWLPLYYTVGENLFITLIFLLVAISFSQIISYYILQSTNNKLLNIIFLLLIIVFVIAFAYFTYNPLLNSFFLDPINQKYGINTYIIK